MTPRLPSAEERLERKIDDLAAAVAGGVAKIGRLEERMTGFMALVEQIEGTNREDLRKLSAGWADHEARLRALEAGNAASAAAKKVGDKSVDRVIDRLILPILVLLVVCLVSVWDRSRSPAQVSVTSAPVINPATPRPTP